MNDNQQLHAECLECAGPIQNHPAWGINPEATAELGGGADQWYHLRQSDWDVNPHFARPRLGTVKQGAA